MAGIFLLTLLGTDNKYENKIGGTKVRVETLSFMHDAAIGQDITTNVKNHTFSEVEGISYVDIARNGTKQTKAIIDGASSTGGDVYEKVGEATLAILEQVAQGQTTINIQAHSRGSCEAILVAHEIQRLINIARSKKTEENMSRDDIINSEEAITRAYLSTGAKKPLWIQEILKSKHLVNNLKATKINIFAIDPVPGDSVAMSWVHTLITPVSFIVSGMAGLVRQGLGKFRLLPEGLSKLNLENFPWNDQRFFELPECVTNYTQAIPEFEESAFFNSIMPKAKSIATNVNKVIFGGNHSTASGGMGFQTKDKNLPITVQQADGSEITYDTSTTQELIACKIADFHQTTSDLKYDINQDQCIEKSHESYPDIWNQLRLQPLKLILGDFLNHETGGPARRRIFLGLYNKMAANWPGYMEMAKKYYAYHDGHNKQTGTGRKLKTADGKTTRYRDLTCQYDSNGQFSFICAEHADLTFSTLYNSFEYCITKSSELQTAINRIKRETPEIEHAFIELNKIVIALDQGHKSENSKLATYLSDPKNYAKLKGAIAFNIHILGSSETFNCSKTIARELTKVLQVLQQLSNHHKEAHDVFDVITPDGGQAASKNYLYNFAHEMKLDIESMRINYFNNELVKISYNTLSVATNAYFEGKGNPQYLLEGVIIKDLNELISQYQYLHTFSEQLVAFLEANLDNQTPEFFEFKTKVLQGLYLRKYQIESGINKLIELDQTQQFIANNSTDRLLTKHGHDLVRKLSPTATRRSSPSKFTSISSDDEATPTSPEIPAATSNDLSKFIFVQELCIIRDMISHTDQDIYHHLLESKDSSASAAVRSTQGPTLTDLQKSIESHKYHYQALRLLCEEEFERKILIHQAKQELTHQLPEELIANISIDDERMTDQDNIKIKNCKIQKIGGIITVTGVAISASAAIAFAFIPGANILILGVCAAVGVGMIATSLLLTLYDKLNENMHTSKKPSYEAITNDRADIRPQ